MDELDVVCVGPAAVDTVYLVDDFPSPDEITLAQWCRHFCGGSAANVSVGLSRLGVRSGLISKVGEDEEGKELLERLISEGVNVRGVTISRKTARTTVLINRKGEKVIITDTEGVLKDTNDIREDYVKKAAILYIGECFVPVAEKVVKMAGKKVVRIKNVHVCEGIDVGTIVSEADFVIMNEKTYTQYKGKDENVIVTLGEKGCLYVKERLEVPGVKVDSVDTTGAGDAFCAGFISMILEKRPLEEALRFANAAGAVSTTKYGAMDSMPSRKEVELLL